MNFLSKIFKIFFIVLIDFYQFVISPLFPSVCRFYPSCSNYARQSLEIHGFFRGLFLILKRICKCHPFHPGGYDPVPPLINRS